MLYASDLGSLRGRIWKLPNGYWRGCNWSGAQCTFRLHNEAKKFAETGKLAEYSSDSIAKAQQYVRSTRNASKKKYAEQYLQWKLGRGPEPERPNDLSVMAAQAVEMTLNSILPPVKTDED